MGLLRDKCGRVKEGTSAVLLQSGLDEKWWADSVECSCCLRNVQDLLADGKTPHDSQFGEPFKGTSFRSVQWFENHPISAKDQSRHHQCAKTVSPGTFLGCALVAGGIWQRDFTVADIEEFGKLDASEILARRLNAKEVLTSIKGWNIHIPVRGWNSEIVWKRARSPRTPSSGRINLWWVKISEKNFKETRGCLNQQKHKMTLKLAMTSGPSKGDFIYRRHTEPRVHLYVPKEESFPIPLKYIDATRTTQDDYWNVDVDRHLKDSRAGCTKCTWFQLRNLQDICGPGGALHKFKQLPDLTFSGLRFGLACQKAARKKEIQEWAIEKPKLDNARKLRGIYFIDPEDGEYKDTIKNAKEKVGGYRWKLLCFTSWLRRSVPRRCRKPTAKPKNPTKSKRPSMPVLWQLTKPQGSVWSLLFPEIIRNHEDHISEKGVLFNDSLQFGAHIYSHAPSDENSRCKSRSGQRMEDAREDASMATGQGKEQEKVYLDAQKRNNKVHIATLMDICPLKNVEVRIKAFKIQRASRAPRWHCQRRLRCMRSILRTRIVSFSNDSSIEWWTPLQGYLMVQGKTPTQYLLTPESKWRTLQGCLKNSKVRMSRYMDTSSTTQVAQIMVKHRRAQWFFSNEICTITRMLASCGKDSSRKFCWWWKKVPNWECLFAHRKTRIILIWKCGWHQHGWKKTENGSHVEEIDETCGPRRTNIISWPRVFWMHSTWM